MRRLGDEEQAATNQDDVAPGYSHAENGKERRGEAHQPSEPSEHDHAEDECERQTHLAGAACLVRLETGGEDRNEYEIVDSEHERARRQRAPRGPREW